MVLLDVKAQFEKALGSLFPLKPEVTRFLIRHERKQRCIENLCSQIALAEAKMGARFQKRHLDEVIKSVVRLFAQTALQHKEEQLLSQAQKNALIKPTMQDAEAELAERGILIHEAPRNSGTGRQNSGAKGPGLA